MKILTASIGLGLGLLLVLPAHAGPCTTEIETLTQALASAGTDTNPSAPATPGLPKAPSTSGTLPHDPLAPQQPPKLPDSQTIPKAPSTAGSLPPNPLESTATAAGNKVTDPGAMPQDGATPQDGGTGSGGEAVAALQRARELDLAGDEAGCMTEITKAKDLIVTQ